MDLATLRSCGIEKSPDGMEWVFSLITSLSPEKQEPIAHEVSAEIPETIIDSIKLEAVEEAVQQRHTADIADSNDPKTPVDATKKKKPRAKKTKRIDSGEPKSVSWGHVEEVTFSRALGACVVPHHGSYPLGLGIEVSSKKIALDDHLHSKRRELIDRAANAGVLEKFSRQLTSGLGHESAGGTEFILETRQYDYNSSRGRNPLFSSLEEVDRHLLLLCHEVTPGADTTTTENHDELAARRRTRSNSTNSSHDNGFSAHGIGLSDINKELEVIRRSREASSGCSCKPLKVDKLSTGKIKAELQAHAFELGIDDPSKINGMSKAESNEWMKKWIKICPVCVAGNCSCVAQEIECSAEVCGCLRRASSSSSSTASINSSTPPSDDIPPSDRSASGCGNKFGFIKFDPERVDEQRRAILRYVNKLEGSDVSVVSCSRLASNTTTNPIHPTSANATTSRNRRDRAGSI